jgi:alpha-methylacyl-CoA racemase
MFKPLKGTRILSLALNLPGPAALQRCRGMGATCVKLEPPAPQEHSEHSERSIPIDIERPTGDPMSQYSARAYQELHVGIKTITANLKTEKGQAVLHKELARADILLTSFRPSALTKLGLAWTTLKKQYPRLSLVSILGARGDRAEEPGHDLTYLAECGLVTDLNMPATLFADMAGSLMASEAVLQAKIHATLGGHGVRLEVALNEASAYLAQPRAWGLTLAGQAVGGGHAGYRVYPCKDGRVAIAALEPHFAHSLAMAIDLPQSTAPSMFSAETHTAVAAFVATKTRRQLNALAKSRDIPLYTLV